MDRTEFSPAKINLNLHILGRQADGYHALFSLVCFADYGDELSFSGGGGADQLEVSGPFGNDIKGENIILKASALLRLEVQGVPFGTFRLHKNLPVASGMGGGSANAAAALRLLSRYVPNNFEEKDWQKLALQLGADVPVCLRGKSAYMSGIGEILTVASGVKPSYAVLVNPLVGVSTAKVFQQLKARPLERNTENLAFRSPIFNPKAQSFEDYLSSTRNDLEKPAMELEPLIKQVLGVLEQQEGCFLSRMSGSGATCFGLFKTKEFASNAILETNKYSKEWWICSSILG